MVLTRPRDSSKLDGWCGSMGWRRWAGYTSEWREEADGRWRKGTKEEEEEERWSGVLRAE